MFRAVIPARLCDAKYLPSGCAQTDPVLCVAVEHADALPIKEHLKRTLSSVKLSDLAPHGAAFLCAGASTHKSLFDACRIIGAAERVSPEAATPFRWFAAGGERCEAGDSSSRAEDCVCVLRPESFGTNAIAAILSRAADVALDVCGLRLVFPERGHCVRARSISSAYVVEGAPCLVLALRGVRAMETWGNAVGPEDPLVAKMTDAGSLRAQYGIDKSRNLLR